MDELTSCWLAVGVKVAVLTRRLDTVTQLLNEPPEMTMSLPGPNVLKF